MQLNVAGVTGVARTILPGMMERGKGVVINVSSTTAAIPSPYLSVYAASKAYIDKLSADLATEAAPRGVTVQCILPGPVATKMSKIKYKQLAIYYEIENKIKILKIFNSFNEFLLSIVFLGDQLGWHLIRINLLRRR